MRWLFLFVALVACSGKDGASGQPGQPGRNGTSIHALTANPPVIRPGGTTQLMVSAGDPGAQLTYRWSASEGSLSSSSANPVAWTAPDKIGAYEIDVDVTGDGFTSHGFASVLVSASPTGPVITSVSPHEVKVGAHVTISGAGFGPQQGTSTLTLGGINTIAEAWSDSAIVAVVPSLASSGNVRVEIGGAQSNAGELVVLWSDENPINTKLNGVPAGGSGPQIVSDDAGGAVVVWGAGDTIYAQRVTSSGAALWQPGGVASSVGGDSYVEVIPDGAGGAFAAWVHRKQGSDSDIYAQHVLSAGALAWSLPGVAVCSASRDQQIIDIVPDGAGGMIVAWYDDRANSGGEIYAQRMSASGKALWTMDGVRIAGGSLVGGGALVSDGNGGAIVEWEDGRNGLSDIYAQRFDSTGKTVWAIGGVPISQAPNYQAFASVITDGVGGAVMAWVDRRTGGFDVYAQRIDPTGKPLWLKDGLPISTAAGEQNLPALVSDGSTGAVIAWMDDRSGDFDIYAQRVSGAGNISWLKDGAPITVLPGDQMYPSLASDSAGGVIMAWSDFRVDVTGDLYAQRVSSASQSLWTPGGVSLATAIGGIGNVKPVSDAFGGAIFVWNGVNYGVYAQGISADARQ